MLLRYLATDTLLCWAPEKSLHDPEQDESIETLRNMQQRIATPIISHLTTHVWEGVEIRPVLTEDSILPQEQPQQTLAVIAGWLTGVPAFELAGIERAVLATKSLCTAVRLVTDWSEELNNQSAAEERFGIEDAAEAASAEVRWQTGQWGEVEDTHDVEKEDIRRQLGSVVLLVNGSKRKA